MMPGHPLRRLLLVTIVASLGACEAGARDADAAGTAGDVQATDIDAAPADAVGKDVSVLDADAVPSDAAIDGSVPDAPTDVATEVAASPRAAFRVITLDVAGPALCYPPGPSCLPLNALVSETLQSAIDDVSDPFVLVGLFHEFLAPEGTHVLAFGAGACQGAAFDGPCTFDTSNPAAVSDLDVAYGLTGTCGVAVAAPCFRSDARDVLLAFPAFGGSMGLRMAVLNGEFSTKDTIENGGLEGFLPRSLAQTYALTGVGAGPVPLSELFADAPTEVDGEPGWWITLRWTAVKVDWID